MRLADSSARDAAHPITVRNLSPRFVTICGDGIEISLPPLGEHAVHDASLRAEIESPEASAYIETYRGTTESDEAAAVVVGLTFWLALIGAAVVALLTDGVLPVVAFVTLCIAVAIVAWRVKRSSSWGAVVRWGREKAALLLVLMVGFGIPAIVLLFATQLFDQLRSNLGDALDAPLNRVVT